MINEADNKYSTDNSVDERQHGGRKKTKLFVLLGIATLVVLGSVIYYISNPSTLKHKSSSIKKAGISKGKVNNINNTEVNIDNDKNAPLKSSSIKDNSSLSNNDNTNDKNLIALDKAVRPLSMKVNLDSQRVYIYDAKNQLVKEFVCSSGESGYDTPKGTYTIKERGYSFYSSKYKEGAYYWVQFMGNYLFHSVPFDKNQVIETAEVQKLGQKASHGCVRLAIDDAKWIYDNIPRGTSVVIK